VLTIGYLMVEAYAVEVIDNNGRTVPANVVGYDHESGFGLLRAIEPLRLKPMMMGKSAEIIEHDPVLISSFGGVAMVGAAYVVAKREFAGSWEYLLDEALFTAPRHPAWSGAALISREGKLVGIGSLIVGDAAGGNEKTPGNMFVPIDRLQPILADLIAHGRRRGRTGAQERAGTGRRHQAEREPRAEELAARPARMDRRRPWRRRGACRLYRKVWAQGRAGTTVPLDVLHNDQFGGSTSNQSIGSITSSSVDVLTGASRRSLCFPAFQSVAIGASAGSVGGLRQLRSFEKLKPKASLGRGVYCRGRCWGNRRLSLNHR
jgi:hypothetical protein